MRKKSAYAILWLFLVLLAPGLSLEAGNVGTLDDDPCNNCSKMSNKQRRKCARLQSSADVNGSYSMGVGSSEGMFNGLSQSMQTLLALKLTDLRDPSLLLPPTEESARADMPGSVMVSASDGRLSQVSTKDLFVDFLPSGNGYSINIYEVSETTPQTVSKNWTAYDLSYAGRSEKHQGSTHDAYSTSGLKLLKRVEVNGGDGWVAIEEYDYFLSQTSPGRKRISWSGVDNGYPVRMEVSTPEKGIIMIDSISNRARTGGRFDEFTQRHTRQEQGANGQMYEIYNALEKAITLDYGEMVILERTQTDGGITHNTKWDYYLDRGNTTNFGRAKSMRRSDGYWESYEYAPAADGFVYTKKISQWMGSTFGDEANSVVETSLVNDTWGLTYNETKAIRGNLVYKNTSDRQVNVSDIVENKYEWTSASQYMLTKTYYYLETEVEAVRGKLKSITYPDGTSERYEYVRLSDSNLKTTYYSRDGIRTIRTTLPNESVLEEYSTHTATNLELSYKKADVNSKDVFGRYTKYYHSRTDTSDYSIEKRGSCGLIDYRRDRDGLETRYTYDYDNRLAKTESGYSGGVTTIEEILRNGNTTIKRKTVGTMVTERKFEHNQMEQLIKETAPDVNGDGQVEVTTYSYAMPGNGVARETVTYSDGTTMIIERYGDDRLKRVYGAAEIDTVYTYGTWSGGSWIRKTIGGSASQSWIQEYKDLSGQLVKSEQHLGNNAVATTNYVYNTKGQLTKQTNPDGMIMLYAYNTFGQLSQQAMDMNRNSYADISGTDLIISYTYTYVNDSELGISKKITQTTYATANSATATILSENFSSVDGFKTRTVQLGQISRTTQTRSVNGDYTYTEQDNVGCKTVYDYKKGILNKRTTYDASGNSIHWTGYTFDGFGNVTKLTDARKGDRVYTYYSTGLLKTETDEAGYTTRYAYDKQGSLTQITFPDNTIQYRNYTTLGQLKKIWGAQTYTQAYEYDALGNLSKLLTYKDGDTATAQVTNWLYDSAGRMTEKNYGGINPVRYEYSSGGLLKKRTWARGVVTTYAHDNAGRLLSETYNDGTLASSFTYNRIGQLIKAGNINYTYDASLRLLTDGSIGKSYDSYGRLLKMTNGADYAVDYTYDTASRLKTVSMDGKSFTYNYLTHASYLIENLTSPVHTVTNAYETKRDVLVSKENKAGTNMISKHAYTVNNLLQRTQRVQTGTAFGGSMTENYAYNTRSEITATNNPTQSVLNTAYTYDGIGNRKTASFGGSSYSYTANNLNQYSAFSINSVAKNPTYDLDGNMTFDGAQTYVYDAENRLVKVIKSVGNEVRYAYDVLSRRIKREVVEGGSIVETANYAYDGWNLIAEDVGGRISRSTKYIWGLDVSGSIYGAGGVGGLLAEAQSNGANPIWRYFTYDGNGNTSEVLDATGSMIAHYDYDAFGNTIKTAGSHATANSWRFSTKPLDPETGLYYYGYRFYSSSLGRWLNRDLINERGGVHIYAFVENDVINYVDMWGLEKKCCGRKEYESSTHCCYKNKIERVRDECYSVLFVGHSGARFELTVRNTPLSYCDKASAVTCSRIKTNDYIKNNKPDAYYSSSGRKDNQIFPDPDKFYDNARRRPGDQKVEDAYKLELEAAKEEAKKQCATGCCKKIIIGPKTYLDRRPYDEEKNEWLDFVSDGQAWVDNNKNISKKIIIDCD